MYLLDTNVVSETRKPRPHPAVLAWLNSIPSGQMFLAAITLAELQKGVEITRGQNAEKASEIERWLDRLATAFEILPADGVIFREWAKIMRGRPEQNWEDGLIAATARIHHLVVATRNVRDFDHFDVQVFNPFS